MLAAPVPVLMHAHIYTLTCQCQWLYMSVHSLNMIMKSYLDKSAALQGLLNSNGRELAWLNAAVAILVLPRGTGPLAEHWLCCLAWVLVLACSAKGDRGPAKSTVA